MNQTSVTSLWVSWLLSWLISLFLFAYKLTQIFFFNNNFIDICGDPADRPQRWSAVEFWEFNDPELLGDEGLINPPTARHLRHAGTLTLPLIILLLLLLLLPLQRGGEAGKRGGAADYRKWCVNMFSTECSFLSVTDQSWVTTELVKTHCVATGLWTVLLHGSKPMMERELKICTQVLVELLH